MLHRTNPAIPAGTPQETAMYQNINEQFVNSTRQFAETAAEVNRLALENAQNVFGLQMAAIEENTTAAFAFLGEMAEVRDMDDLKAVWPKGVQVARQNAERSVSTGQEVLGRTLKTNEAIAQIAKSQLESATAKAQANAEEAVKATGKTTKRK
jgi:hypothetical protein